MVAIREDLDLDWDWDGFEPTHSEASLAYDKWVEPLLDQDGFPSPTVQPT